MCVYIYIYIYACKCVYIYIYIYIHVPHGGRRPPSEGTSLQQMLLQMSNTQCIKPGSQQHTTCCCKFQDSKVNSDIPDTCLTVLKRCAEVLKCRKAVKWKDAEPCPPERAGGPARHVAREKKPSALDVLPQIRSTSRGCQGGSKTQDTIGYRPSLDHKPCRLENWRSHFHATPSAPFVRSQLLWVPGGVWSQG